MIQRSRAVPPTADDTDGMDGETIVEGTDTVRSLLTALNTEDGRAILDATSERARSASEIADTCDIALSTTYRKLNLFTDAGLLEERTRTRCGGKPISEYRRTVEEIGLDIAADGGLTVRVSQRDCADSTAVTESFTRR